MEHACGEVRGTDEVVERALGTNPLPAVVVSLVYIIHPYSYIQENWPGRKALL